jgi:PQQ enzyme repeat
MNIMRENPQMRIQQIKHKTAFLFLLIVALRGTPTLQGAVNVTQYHNHESRDGLYIDPAFTRTAAAALKRDTNFTGNVSGNIYAQPLYIEDGPGGKAMVITVTESNNVYALDAANGGVLWQRHVGQPVPRANLPCGNIDPMGITGTPVVDLPSRTLFFDAMTTPDGGTTKKHFIFALNVDTGTTNAGWPVDLNATVRFGTNVFNSTVQGERSALALSGGYVYSTYGGHAGDCGNYFGWLVGIPVQDPSTVHAWATSIRGGGSWSVGGAASDGVDLFVATGNTFGTTNWAGGESIIRFTAAAAFSGQTNDFWTPTNWVSLDSTDKDLGGSGALIVDVPGATPSKLILALGKDGNAYLLNRTNLGGISLPLSSNTVSSSSIIQAAVTYQTTQGVYVVFCPNTSQLAAYRVTPTSPPTLVSAWTVSQGGRGSPFVTSTDGSNNVVVWGIGAGSDQRLHGFDGNTGAVVFNGGGANELMAGTHAFQTAIAARGRIFVATDRKIYAFAVPVPQPVIVLSNPTLLPDGSFQFDFTNIPGMGFSVFRSTNLSLPLTNWSLLGPVTENPPGQFRFIDPPVDLDGPRLYRVRSP